MSKPLQPFPWYGGKRTHLDFILPNLPDTHEYVEPFGGSATVLLSRDPSPVETYNDIDEDVVTFFRVLREDREELVDKLEQTPYSRREFMDSIDAMGNDSLEPVEQARLFFVRAAQVYSGLAQRATPGRWSYNVTNSREGQSGVVSAWESRISRLEAVADRLRRVQLECSPALKVIDRFDSPDALFYCDPPYPPDARGDEGKGTKDQTAYGTELSARDHKELADVLHSVEGKVAISSYRTDLYEYLYGDWFETVADAKQIHTKHTAEPEDRREVLYTNYDPSEISPKSQARLDTYE